MDDTHFPAGRSARAGGVVLGAALNVDPRAFGAAVLRCAFLELLGSCSDASQPLTAHEWDEWGDPTDPRDWAALAALCPYHNLDRRPGRSDATWGGGAGGGGEHGRWRAAVLASCAAEVRHMCVRLCVCAGRRTSLPGAVDGVRFVVSGARCCYSVYELVDEHEHDRTVVRTRARLSRS